MTTASRAEPTLEPTLDPTRLETRLADKKPLLTDAEARAEAERCLYCADAPCIQACPTEIDIPTFIKKIASGNVRGSAKTIFEQNLLGVSCSRVCPVEVLCVGSCVYGAWGREPIAIGRLQRFATETTLTKLQTKGGAPLFEPRAKTGKRVALVGGGPASLACAGTLALDGHTAVIFEKRPLAGGLNTTGIAPYKLHAEASLAEVAFVQGLGVEIRTGHGVGEPGGPSAESLLAEFDAVFLGLGLGADTTLGVPGEEGPGVEGATAWIERMKLARAAEVEGPAGLGHVVVVGGGNTALDVAREAAQLGAASVTMVYRRGEGDMSGYAHELEAARTEGVVLATHRQPVAFVRDAAGKLVGLRVAKTDASGKPVAGTEHELPADLVTLAIGQSKLQELAKAFAGLALDPKGRVVVDAKTRRSGHPKVYAGGDCINGGKEVVNAVADGRDAAKAMHDAFTSR